VTTKATRWPSGEMHGLLRNVILYKSSIVIERDM